MSQCNPTTVVHRAACAGLALALAGCATPPVARREGAEAPARLQVVNLTDHAWRVAFVPTGTQLARTVEITPRARTEIELPAGPWAIEQAMLRADGRPGQTRRFPASLAAGETYHWPLATLLTLTDEGGATR
ncbi:MAG: hypothetical protein HZA93_15670 [Verrucomicrobia bacterium]|nr:hypothetical protein [Verrucomicrobiota bacterium]